MSQEFVILRLNGGLGNQMFQWALARMIKETTDMEVYLDMSYFDRLKARPYQLDIFNIDPLFVENPSIKLKLKLIWMFRKFLSRKKTFGFKLFSEKQFNFDRDIYRVQSKTYIDGFFQSEKYFKKVEEQLRVDFRFKRKPSELNRKFINEILETNSIALHIRRGDYVEKQRYQELYAQCSLDYYKRGVEYIAEKYPNPTIFIFSDDIHWAKKNLKLPYKCIFISGNNNETSFEDMRLMSLCNHNIIANSSFSWWGAWLNSHPDKIVIAPKKWFNDRSIVQTDIIPENWVQISN